MVLLNSTYGCLDRRLMQRVGNESRFSRAHLVAGCILKISFVKLLMLDIPQV